MNQVYTVHKTFLDGGLKGLTITEQTSVRFETGKAYGGGWTGPGYEVTAAETITPNLQPPTPPTDQPPATSLHATI